MDRRTMIIGTAAALLAAARALPMSGDSSTPLNVPLANL